MKLILTSISLLIILLGFQNCSEIDTSGEGYSASILAKANYRWLQANIFTPKCVNCHTAGQEFGGLNTTSYYRIMEFVIPGDPENSRLYIRTFDRTTFTLSELEQNIIKAWIANGAKND